MDEEHPPDDYEYWGYEGHSREYWEQIDIWLNGPKLPPVEPQAAPVASSRREEVFAMMVAGLWWPTYSPDELADILLEIAEDDDERALAEQVRLQPGAVMQTDEMKTEALHRAAALAENTPEGA